MRGAAEIVEIPQRLQAAEPAARKLDRLALLYEGILTMTGRIRIGQQPLQNPEEFRDRIKKSLAEVELLAARRGYPRESVYEGTFAVVAFLDEAILTAPGEASLAWIGNTLGQAMYDQRSAGELFFTRLGSLQAHRDSQDLAEILEVYYLCLLLGFEGKFAGGAKGELLQLMANLRERIERIFGSTGGRDAEFSPDQEFGEEPTPPVMTSDPLSRQLRLFALAALVFALCCYVGFSLALHSQTRTIHRLTMERVEGER